MYQLSEGLLEKVMSGANDMNTDLIFQVIAIKKMMNITPEHVNDLYRLQLSDGIGTTNLVTIPYSLNYLVKSNKLMERSIIKINRWSYSHVYYNGRNRTSMIINNMDVLEPGDKVRQILGPNAVSILQEYLEMLDI